ncbi:MAG: hypothetical protein GY705_06120 [Bacteroidetes bacterium]|nr:hypothetical protein [Bacteroidota bacterium]
MLIYFTSISSIKFEEHPVITTGQPIKFGVSTKGMGTNEKFIKGNSFNYQLYCSCLLFKVYSLPFNDLPEFLNVQCGEVENPNIWLFQLKQLFEINEGELHKVDGGLVQKSIFYLIEDFQKQLLEKNKNHTLSTKKITQPKFDFEQIIEKMKSFPKIQQKRIFLLTQKTRYTQNCSVYEESDQPTFDQKIMQEIDLLNEIEKELAQVNRGLPFKKVNIRYPIFVLADILFQLHHEKKFFSGSLRNLAFAASHIFNDKKGKPLNPETLYTSLKPSKPEKRPSGEKRIKVYLVQKKKDEK